MATKRKRTKPRRYRRDYGHPTPTTVSPELRKRQDAMIDTSDLSARAMFHKLDLGSIDGVGLKFESFKRYVSKRRHAAGRRHISKPKVEGAAYMVFGLLSKIFPPRVVNRVIRRLVELGEVADKGKPVP